MATIYVIQLTQLKHFTEIEKIGVTSKLIYQSDLVLPVLLSRQQL
jgi:hypothetical protein